VSVGERPVIAVTSPGVARWVPGAGQPPGVGSAALAVQVVGGQPLLVWAGLDEVGATIARSDGLLLPGGADVEPALYGQAASEATQGVLLSRDLAEAEFVRTAIAAGLPILAICRGCEMLNVALGGTLIQHLPERTDRPHVTDTPGFVDHDVEIEPGTRLAAALGNSVEVRSWHHQAIDQPAPGIRITATSPDGVIEGIELDSDGWVVGVQWHPEESSDLRVLQAFVHAARRRAEARGDA
jgi:putative glutamine amidotransferase